MKNRLNLSKAKHKIIFLKNVENSEIEEQNWEEFAVSFAEVKPLADNRFLALENMNFGAVITEELFLFSVRFIKDITADMRIKFNDHTYEIKRIINAQEKNRALNIIALRI